jgi:hypothetical protein
LVHESIRESISKCHIVTIQELWFGPQGPPGATIGPWIYLTFDSCGGTNGNHDVTCNVHDETGITHLTCTVADPAISGGVNVGNCVTNNNKHLQCTIPPTPGVFGCNLQS